MSTLQLDIDGVDSALERNRSFAAAGGHQGAVMFPNLRLFENVLPDGPLFEVVVIQHTQCGAGAFADDTFRHTYAERIGAEESGLRDHAVLDPAATVARDVQRLRSTRAISPRIRVSGHVYDVVTGLVQTVVPGTTIGAPDLPDSASSGFGASSADATQGRRNGSRPHDDPTQGRRLGSRPDDDPTRAR